MLATKIWPILERISLACRWDQALVVDWASACGAGKTSLLGSDHDVARSSLQE